MTDLIMTIKTFLEYKSFTGLSNGILILIVLGIIYLMYRGGR